MDTTDKKSRVKTAAESIIEIRNVPAKSKQSQHSFDEGSDHLVSEGEFTKARAHDNMLSLQPPYVTFKSSFTVFKEGDSYPMSVRTPITYTSGPQKSHQSPQGVVQRFKFKLAWGIDAQKQSKEYAIKCPVTRPFKSTFEISGRSSIVNTSKVPHLKSTRRMQLQQMRKKSVDLQKDVERLIRITRYSLPESRKIQRSAGQPLLQQQLAEAGKSRYLRLPRLDHH